MWWNSTVPLMQSLKLEAKIGPFQSMIGHCSSIDHHDRLSFWLVNWPLVSSYRSELSWHHSDVMRTPHDFLPHHSSTLWISLLIWAEGTEYNLHKDDIWSLFSISKSCTDLDFWCTLGCILPGYCFESRQLNSTDEIHGCHKPRGPELYSDGALL